MTADAKRDYTVRIWLFLLRHGGRWLGKDVATRTGIDRVLVGQLLSAMARHGQARHFPVQGRTRRFTYGVTPACSLPQSVTVAQVAECLTLMAQPDEEPA